MLIRPHQPPRASHRAAFTLLEVLIVAAIIVVLAGASTLFYMRYLEDAKVSRAKADVKTIEKAAEAYELRFGQRPESLQQLSSPPEGGKPYIEADQLKDPWGKDYSYDASGGRSGGNHPDVWTTTPDGSTTIGSWPGGH
ncbi:MAG TPA: type II secretion system protein GspG [Gemmataceae bacterium]|jgi:general secretion pathway protein G|nr:type II secretion system protein GspG [Gemmataceae bacterium]